MKPNDDVHRLLQELLDKSAVSGHHVTVCGLRDALLEYSDFPQLESKKLYWHVRDRLYRLEKAGDAVRVGTKGARRPVYHLVSGRHTPGDTEPSAPSPADEMTSITRQFENDSAALRAEMQRSLGMLEEYKDAIDGYPALRDRLRLLHEEEAQRAHHLTGRLQGLAKVRQLLADVDKEKTS